MKIIEINDMYECPFKQTDTIMLSELTADTDERCNLRDGDNCDWEKCPMRIHKQYRIKWVGK